MILFIMHINKWREKKLRDDKFFYYWGLIEMKNFFDVMMPIHW